jgi:hypothetical protein
MYNPYAVAPETLFQVNVTGEGRVDSPACVLLNGLDGDGGTSNAGFRAKLSVLVGFVPETIVLPELLL